MGLVIFMSHVIEIDAPGAGDWIMERCQGHYVERYSHSLSIHNDEGEIQGGFVVTDYIRDQSAFVSAAGVGPGWCTRKLLWMLFEYTFHQLNVKKLFALIRSDNYRAIEQDLRAGWKIETTIRDVYPGGIHGVLLYMVEADCPWLKRKPKTCQVNTIPVLAFDHPSADAA